MQPVLVFDGDCAFCTTTANWIERLLPADSRVEPWQFLDLTELGLTEADVSTAAWWVDAWGHRHRGHKAVARAFIAAGGFWRPVGWLLLTPPITWIARPAYALIARYRHRMPGATAACRVPRPNAPPPAPS